LNDRFLGDPTWMRIVDISHHNGDVDLPNLIQAGVGLVIIKATDGAFDHDNMFKTNVQKCEDHGMPYIPYLFVRSHHDPEAQAENLLNITGGKLKLVMADDEWDKNRDTDPDKWQFLPTPKRLEVMGKFYRHLKNALGFYPLTYTSASFWEPTFNRATSFEEVVFTDSPLMVVDVRPQNLQPKLPHGWTDWKIRQCGIGPVGAHGPFDLDIFHGTREEFQSWFAQYGSAPAIAPTTPAPQPFQQARTIKLISPLMKGDDVRELQNALVHLGLLSSVDVDGRFGPRTKIAVQSFQSQSGLEADGAVGNQTRAALNSALHSKG